MSTASDLITHLNEGKAIPTYSLTLAVDSSPILGEIRSVIPLAPAPWEPLAAIIPLDPVRIVWTGTEWQMG